ncbi:hypothetical protein ACUXK4_002210 [Methylorubrum extorquens]
MLAAAAGAPAPGVPALGVLALEVPGWAQAVLVVPAEALAAWAAVRPAEHGAARARPVA